MKKIYLIRHSEALNCKYVNYIDGINDQEQNEKIPLSVIGESKACDLANRFLNLNIKHIWSSSYERAISTAKYIANLNSKTINVSSLFNERKLGNINDVKDEFWLTQLYDENAKTIGGESRKEVTKRMLSGLTIVLSEMKDVDSAVIVSHATSMTFLLMNWCVLKNASLEGKKRHLIFENKDVINDSFNEPEIFKLIFDDDRIVDIERLV